MKNEKNFETTNFAGIKGTLAEDLKYSHEIMGERFFESTVAVERLSGVIDNIPITISERLLEGKNFKQGDFIGIEGGFRSYNKLEEEKSRLILHVFAKDVFTEENIDEYSAPSSNYVFLEGFICKNPVYRTTPFKREICDALLAVNRRHNKSDYIPCICWGRNARYMQGREIGDKVVIEGRIQSRAYNKKFEDGREEERVAYEISVNKMCEAATEEYVEENYEEARAIN